MEDYAYEWGDIYIIIYIPWESLTYFFLVENCLPGKFTHGGEIPGMLEKTWLPGFTPSYPIFNLFPHVLSTASKAKNPLCALEVTF